MLRRCPTVRGSMSGYAEPLAVPSRPIIGVAAFVQTAVLRFIGDPSVNDREISEEADLYRICVQAGIAHFPTNHFEKAALIEKRGVRIGAFEILSKDFLKAAGVAVLYCCNVVFVKNRECLDIVVCHGYLFFFRSWQRLKMNTCAKIFDPMVERRVIMQNGFRVWRLGDAAPA
jgi:hypothetical protein